MADLPSPTVSSDPQEGQQPKRPRLENQPVKMPKVLEGLGLKMQFAQYLHNHHVTKIEVDPSKLIRVFKATYRAMEAVIHNVIVPPLEEEVFVLVCQQLVHRRLQDIEENRTGTAPSNRSAVARSIVVPQPVGELLYALGMYKSTSPYRIFQPVPIAVSTTNPQPWSAVTTAQRGEFARYCSMVASRYMMVEFPKRTETSGNALYFTAKQEGNGICQIFLYNDEPTPADVYLRFIHEEFFTSPPYTAAACEGIGSQALYVQEIIDSYVTSYTTQNVTV